MKDYPNTPCYRPQRPSLEVGKINYTAEQINALLALVPLKADRKDINKLISFTADNFIGHYPDASMLADQDTFAWAFVGDLAAAVPYFHYTAGSAPEGYTPGWNNMQHIFGTYPLFTDNREDQLTAEELFKIPFRLPELTAHRAIADEHGNRIPDTYVTRSAVAEHIRQIYNQLFLENPPLITEGYITPEMLSEETRQMLEATGQEITNLSDGEDISTINGVLKFANKQYNPNSYSGMGRIHLRKNIVGGVNLLTQAMIDKPNTIYIIQYDYDLNGAEITIPANCVLDFQGGKLNNGTVNFDGCELKSFGECLNPSNLTIKGLNCVCAEWFGITTESEDISNAFNALMENLSSLGLIPITVVFKEAVYNTADELMVGRRSNGSRYYHYINIVGYPTFFLKDANKTCISITGANRCRYEFSVKRETPAIWANNDSVGALFENCEYCNIKIHNIMYFTYGIIIRADATLGDGGFAWNEIYIDEIYSSLQGFVIQSINGGWPNANNVHGGIGFNFNTGTYVTTNATEPPRAIVLKSDGRYGANGWSFDGLWLENHNDLKGYVGIDFCDYINGNGMTGCSFNNVRVEYVYGILFKIDSRYNSGIKIDNTVSIISGSAIGKAVDYDGSIITKKHVFNNIDEYLFDNLIKFDLRDELERLNCKTYKIYRGASKIGIGEYGIPSVKVGGFGYNYTSVCIENVCNKEFEVEYYGRMNIYVLDKTGKWLGPEDCGDSISSSHFEWRWPGAPYAYNLNDHDANKLDTRRLRIGASNKIRYLVFAVSEYIGSGIAIRYKHLNGDTTKAFVSNPFGRFSKDAYISDMTLTDLRAKFEVGDKYINIKTGTINEFTESGSIGNIGTILVSAQSGDNYFTTSNDCSNLLVGDLVNVLSSRYEIKSIDKIDDNTTAIYVDKGIAESVSGEQMTLKVAQYK